MKPEDLKIGDPLCGVCAGQYGLPVKGSSDTKACRMCGVLTRGKRK